MSRFSSTVMWGKTRRPSGQWAMPRSRTCGGEQSAMSSPSNMMLPRAGRSSPEIARRVVLLPAPLAPIRATSWPSQRESDTPFSAATLP